MINYLIYWTWWFIWRIAVTFACIFTVQNVVRMESGFWIETKSLLIVAICLIVIIRIWSVRSDYQQDRLDKTAGED